MSKKKNTSPPSPLPKLAIACAISLAFAPSAYADVTFDSGPETHTNAGQGNTGGGDLYIGKTSSASLTLDNSGYDALNTYIGSDAGSNGTLALLNGGIINSSSLLNVGVNGTGTLNASSGAKILGTRISIGTGIGSIGAATVSGTGTSIKSTYDVVIGDAGTGSLTVSNGAAMTEQYSTTVVGQSAGGTGTFIVTGAGTTASLRVLSIGTAGTGTMKVLDGAAVTSDGVTTLAAQNGSAGTLVVSDAGSSYTAAGISVGFSGTGSLTVENGATLTTNGVIMVGQQAAGTGTLIIKDSGTQLNSNTSNLIVGADGQGTMIVSNGAHLTVDGLNLAGGTGSNGVVTITGTGTVLDTPTGYLTIGQNSTGTMTLDDHALVIANFVSIGDVSTGIGSLTIQGGATLTGSSDAALGRGIGSHGSALITGVGSAWNSAREFDIGREGTGELTLADSGTLTVSGGNNLVIGLMAGSTGTLNIGAAANSAAQAPGMLSAAAVVFGAGSGSINFNHTSTNYVFGLNISGGGSVSAESGTTILSGSNSYTGGTTVSGGELLANSATALPGTSVYTINGGTLNLNSYNLTMSSLSGTGGTLALGSALLDVAQTGTTSFAGNITGTGSLVKDGSGSLTLSGNSTFSGGVTLNSGTLGVASSTALGSGTLNLTAGTLDLQASGINVANNILLGTSPVINVSTGTAALSGLITDGGGAGQLIKNGAGTLALSGNNTYSGGTTLNEGALTISSDTALGTGALLMEENTALNFYGAGLRIANAITLTGDPTFNVASGSSVTLSGAIIDGAIAGDLVKTGAGTLILAGNSSYTGGTAVEQGTLTVDGTLVGEVVVSNGATINGSGTTGNTTFNAGSTLATESATSSIAVNGNLHFASGSTYQVALGSAGQSGSVSVAGNLAIDNGALLKLTSSNGVYSLNSLYRIATYNGSETGTFSLANTDFAYITPVITYGDGAIDLTLTPRAIFESGVRAVI